MYKIVLAIRFLVNRRVSYFAIAATALCVFVAFVVVTVLSGLTADFKGYIHGCYGDCVVSSRSLVGFGYYEEFVEALEGTDIVEAFSPVVRSYANIEVSSESDKVKKGGRATTVLVVGVYPLAHSGVTEFGRWLTFHKEDIENTFRPSYDANLPGIVPGAGLLFAYDSEGGFDAGEKVPRAEFAVSVFPLTVKGAPARAGLGEVSTKTFYCSDYTQTGHTADWNVICLPFEQAQRLCAMDTEPRRISAVYIKFRPGVSLGAGCGIIGELWERFAEERAGADGAGLLEKVRVQSWKAHNRGLVAIAETQETFMIVIFGMIGIIAAFIVFVVFYMVVSHKSKDIGILKSVGVSNKGVLGLFLGFGLLVGIMGAVVGALGGWQFLVHMEQIEDWFSEHFAFRLWYGGDYDIGDVAKEIDVRVLATIMVSAICACLVGACIPSWQAARLEPIKALQVTQL
jgi:ABC-type lipoprotein release transport system permease subunit